MNNTFLTRPPSVVISAFKVLKWRDFRVLMICGKRSDLSSQQNEALITDFPSSSDASTSTDSSSSSVGSRLTSAINVVCRFSSFTCWITSASNDALSVCKNEYNIKCCENGMDVSTSLPSSFLFKKNIKCWITKGVVWY